MDNYDNPMFNLNTEDDEFGDEQNGFQYVSLKNDHLSTDLGMI